ncbi:putative RNA polymerase II subunit B1 CTD phosphatase RPAP2 isoform X2 [Haliotis rufescens]|uniref:putative RNA polymerase II subunit B1 CTD phosphatase RPAP2 isoform X2 n=1 Tax=Haliotis rufescens TaxID=6454 RepID=UPI00201F7DC6|nr:putative RNA polymerase II subunit B1 CTD phosphatase RPAP2 isoform X2 [Haliotis rufescens]
MAAQQEKQIRHRVASEEKAFHVVLRLLENPIAEDYLKDAGQLISTSHYADVVEERSIAKDCGYPICSNKLAKVPKQQYKICTKSNMVYDITERKKFCSNFCLKASQFFEKQILTSPVWSREHEPKVDFEFLAVQAKRCAVGDEVLLSLPQTDLKKEVLKLEKQDQISSPKQKQPDRAASPESSTVTTQPQTDDDSSNLLSNIVEHMADMTVADVHQVHGINVDFSEPSTQGEATLEKVKDVCPMSAKIDTLEKEERVTNDQSALEINRIEDESSTVEGKIGQGVSEGEGHVASSEVKGQRNGESKEDYVMRLLSRKKHLLGQLADIQEAEGGKKTDKDESGSSSKESGHNVIDSDEEDDDACIEDGHKIQENIITDMSLEKRTKVSDLHPATVLITDLSASAKGGPTAETSPSQIQTPAKGTGPTAKTSPSQIQTPAKGTGPTAKTSPSQIQTPAKGTGPAKTSPSQIQTPAKGTGPAKTSPSQIQTPAKGTGPTSKTPASTLLPLNAVAKVLEEWVTRDSLKFLGVVEKEAMAVNQPELDKKYGELCKMVADQEKDFESLLGEVQVEDDKQASGPLPDYKQIEAEAKDFELRVREFYRGSVGGRKKWTKDKVENTQSAGSPRQKVQLPTVDSHDQMVIRRKIVLERLDKVIPDLLSPLCLSIQDVSQHLRELVYTFSFTSQNILFKPGQWSLVAFILMKMLALKSKRIQASFKEQSAFKYFNILLTGIGHTLADLDEVVEWLACLKLHS